MSILSSEQTQKNSLLVDSLFVCLVLTLILLILVPSNWSLYGSVRTAPGSQESTHPDLLTGGNISFAADQQYWDANCNHGWSSGARCDSIVARSQFCSVSVNSVYCSEYKNYLQGRLDK